MDIERIGTDDLAYHQAVIEQKREAETVLQHWGRYRAAKDRFGPGEHVDQDGVIHRAPSPEPQ
jgi:hypothetical protein